MAKHFTIIPTKENTNMTDKNAYLSMRGTHMSTGITKMYRLAQSGRSMVEMLGVLAIVGVLSIGGIMGYDYAVAKFRANTIMSELNLRAVPISQQLMQHPEEANTALTLEAGDTLSSGQSVSANVAVNPEYFEFHLTEVDDTTCELVLENYETPAWMMVNGSLYENSTDICSDPDNDMTFVYKNDLGERRNCSSKGFFNLETYKCDCAGGTYFNKDSKDCACPAGHIWSEAERKCIESRCQEGEFETKDGCIRCDDSNTYIMTQSNAKSLCEACGNRVWMTLYSMCIPACVKGESVPNGGNGVCVSCSAESGNFSIDSNVHDYCNACPNRYASAQICYLNDFCNETGKFWGQLAGTIDCFSCDNPNSISLGYDSMNVAQKQKNACIACKNNLGQPNRSVIKVGSMLKCVKTVCDSGEFMGADGSCHACDKLTAHAVNADSGCTSTACNRVEKTVINEEGISTTYCALATCDTTDGKNVLLANGTCQSCTNPSSFASSEEECSRCAGRGWTTGDNQTGVCTELCSYGTHIPHIGADGGQKLCHSCNGINDGSAHTGISKYAKTYCEACGNYLGEDGYCYAANSCDIGSEFRTQSTNNYKFCTSCGYIDKVKMIDHDNHRNMCTSCLTTRRFFDDNNYCYRCDTQEAPSVLSENARNSCKACPDREISADGLCVLITTETR